MNNIKYEVHYLNVSDADAIVIRYEIDNEKYIVLVDAGNVGDTEKIKNYIWNHWKTHTIDLAICTHPDSDHKGGFFGLINDPVITIKEFWINTPEDVITEDEYKTLYPNGQRLSHCRECYNHPSDDSSKNLVDLAISKNVPVYGAYNGKEYDKIPLKVVGPSMVFYHPLAIEILKNNKPNKTIDNSLYEDLSFFSAAMASSSIDEEDDDCSPTNAGSILILFNPMDSKFLLLGDANRAAISNMLINHPSLTNCKIKVPHHGSKHNLNSSLIDSLKPACAIISAKGSRKHPSRGVVHCLSKHCNVYSTHKSGSLYHTSEPVTSPATPLKKKQ